MVNHRPLLGRKHLLLGHIVSGHMKHTLVDNPYKAISFHHQRETKSFLQLEGILNELYQRY